MTVSLLHTDEVDGKKTADDWLSAPKSEIFHCQQRLLFRKYAKDREASMQSIEKACLAAVAKSAGAQNA